MEKETAPSRPQLPHLETTTFHPSPDTFLCFPDFPTEVRLLIWRAAIHIDFSTVPITVKPYSHNSPVRRVPPKTSRVNRESREVTLKHFRRIELRCSELQGSRGHRWLRRYLPTHSVLWDHDSDILTLDWWCLIANVNNVISYLSLEPFVDEETGSINCVQILEIDSKIWNLSLGLHRETIEKNLSYFVRLREVRFLNWALYHKFEEERQLVRLFEDCLKKLATQNKGYCVPRVCIMLTVHNAGSFQL